MLDRIGVLSLAAYSHRDLMRFARHAEQLGFWAYWYADERFYHETYVGLTACALATSRIKLGPAVTDPYSRHPALTAMAMGSLDDVSGGRAILGFGAGSMGFEQLGFRLHRPAATLRDAITIIRKLWAGGPVTYEGETLFVRGGALHFETRPDLPIYLAADGPYTLRVAGELADAVVIPHCASPTILRAKLEHVRTGAEKVGREGGPRVVARIDISVSNDREAALYEAKVRLARRLWRLYPKLDYLESHGLSLPTELERRLQAAGPFPKSHDLSLFPDAIPDELVYPIAVAGTPAEVGEQLQRVFAGGADEVMAYLLVPAGETLESVMTLTAEAATTAAGTAPARPGGATS
jgi:5,10-methylenetetrahydromethanopterin reductase